MQQCSQSPAPAAPRRLKFSYLEQREFDTIDDEIATLEQQIKDLDAQMIRDASDHTLLLKHAAEKEKVEETLSDKMERWVYLHDLNEKIQAQSPK